LVLAALLIDGKDFCGDGSHLGHILRLTSTEMGNRLHSFGYWELNREKTRIVNLRRNRKRLEFLGYQIGLAPVRADRSRHYWRMEPAGMSYFAAVLGPDTSSFLLFYHWFLTLLALVAGLYLFVNTGGDFHELQSSVAFAEVQARLCNAYAFSTSATIVLLVCTPGGAAVVLLSEGRAR
jgi:hypothetical protein